MTDSTSLMTFQNPIPDAVGILSYTVTDSTGVPNSFIVPYNGSVQHPTDGDSGPWLVAATLTVLPPSSISSSAPASKALTGAQTAYEDPNAVVTVLWTAPIAVPASPAPAVSSVLDFSTWPVVGTAPALGQNLALDFNMQRQAYSNWCWAAVTSSVADFYPSSGSVPSQCELANRFVRTDPGCDGCNAKYGPGAKCNIAHSLRSSLAFVDCLGDVVDAKASFDTVKKEIDAKRPLGLRIAWNKKAVGHVLCINGYDSDHQNIYITDPYDGSESTVAFSGFPGNHYPGTTWSHTYKTKAPSAS